MTTWMLTASGRKVKPAELEPADVCIEDIAHHLSHLCRFTGASRVFYSVAEHSLLVAQIVAEAAPDEPRTQLAALLHDATEAYLTDLATPVKALLPGYRIMESMAWLAISQAFDVPIAMPDAVKRADLLALAVERRDLMPAHPEIWPHLIGIEAPAHLHAVGLRSQIVRGMFLDRFEALLLAVEEAAQQCPT